METVLPTGIRQSPSFRAGRARRTTSFHSIARPVGQAGQFAGKPERGWLVPLLLPPHPVEKLLALALSPTLVKGKIVALDTSPTRVKEKMLALDLLHQREGKKLVDLTQYTSGERG